MPFSLHHQKVSWLFQAEGAFQCQISGVRSQELGIEAIFGNGGHI